MGVIDDVITPAFGFSKAVVYEAIYASTICDSGVGWSWGVQYAMDRRGNGKFSLLIGLIYDTITKGIFVWTRSKSFSCLIVWRYVNLYTFIDNL